MTPHALGLRGPADPTLLERLAALRTELELPPAFPAPVLAEAEAAAREVHAGLTGSPDHADRTALPFVTVDPAGSTDLDQALYLEAADGDAITVRYAIADVPAFVAPGGAVDAEDDAPCPEALSDACRARLSAEPLAGATVSPDALARAALREMVMFDQVSSRPSARRGTIWLGGRLANSGRPQVSRINCRSASLRRLAGTGRSAVGRRSSWRAPFGSCQRSSVR